MYMLKNESVYFYCLGINVLFFEGKVKFGYIFYCKVMVYFVEKGFKFYDFMGGDV